VQKKFLFFDCIGEDTKLKMNRTTTKCKKFFVDMQKKISADREE